ncbi:MAG: hypothetical protein AAF662_02215, partial [Pseudomonadota bacterium]
MLLWLGFCGVTQQQLAAFCNKHELHVPPQFKDAPVVVLEDGLLGRTVAGFVRFVQSVEDIHANNVKKAQQKPEKAPKPRDVTHAPACVRSCYAKQGKFTITMPTPADPMDCSSDASYDAMPSSSESEGGPAR